ncbi:MAG: hypothetical protein LBJ18_02315 [Rickettsiales bacterium]|jgi:hypothetical protein|nr:hypothetical protein [Rickettsiales bacterium]
MLLKKIIEDFEILKFAINGDPVSILTGNEFQKDDTPLTDKVLSFYNEKFNAMAENPDIGVVILDKRAIKDDIAHGLNALKSAAFMAVPDVIMKGRLYSECCSWKERNYDSFVIVAPIQVADSRCIMSVIVKKSDKQRLYLHRIDVIKSPQEVLDQA